jgi:cAMP-dependent protein kinase regulator
VLEHFHRVPLFASVSKSGLRSIAAAATEVDVVAGKTVVRQGEFGRELYVIVRGTADIVKDGRKVSELAPGDFFGEMAFLCPGPRAATVTARSDMRLMVLDSRAMAVVTEREPIVARRLLEAMARRLRTNEQSITA